MGGRLGRFGFSAAATVGLFGLGLSIAVEERSSVSLKIRDGGRIIVPVRIQGRGSYDFLLDTGADCTIFDSRLAKECELRPAPSIRIRTFAGVVDVAQADVKDLSVGSQFVKGIRVVCADLRVFFGLPQEIQGILGQDFLSQQDYLLSYRDRRIQFDADGALALAIQGGHLPLERRNAKYYLATSDTGEGARFLLDSGVPYPVIYERPGRKTQLDGMIAEGRELTAESSLGKRKLRACRLKSLRLGEARFKNLQVYLAPLLPGETPWEDGILPLSMFEAIFFCNSGNFVVMNPSVPR